jgi:hypothetical protein
LIVSKHSSSLESAKSKITKTNLIVILAEHICGYNEKEGELISFATCPEGIVSDLAHAFLETEHPAPKVVHVAVAVEHQQMMTVVKHAVQKMIARLRLKTGNTDNLAIRLIRENKISLFSSLVWDGDLKTPVYGDPKASSEIIAEKRNDLLTLYLGKDGQPGFYGKLIDPSDNRYREAAGFTASLPSF